MGDGIFYSQVDGGKVYVEKVLPLGFVQLPNWYPVFANDRAGIVDHDIYLTKLTDDRIDKISDFCVDRKVAGNRLTFSPVRANFFGDALNPLPFVSAFLRWQIGLWPGDIG